MVLDVGYQLPVEGRLDRPIGAQPRHSMPVLKGTCYVLSHLACEFRCMLFTSGDKVRQDSVGLDKVWVAEVSACDTVSMEGMHCIYREYTRRLHSAAMILTTPCKTRIRDWRVTCIFGPAK